MRESGATGVKRAVQDFLQLGMNQGRWYFDRLNSGKIIAYFRERRACIELCREGTADFIVVKREDLQTSAGAFTHARVIFLETKSTTGKQREAQKQFEQLIEEQGGEYFLIRSVDDAEEVLR